MKNLSLTLTLLISMVGLFAQNAGIKGVLVDKSDTTKLTKVDILLFKNNLYQHTLTTDTFGRFEATNLSAGSYTVEIRYTNFRKYRKEGVEFLENKVLQMDTISLAPLVFTVYGYEENSNYGNTNYPNNISKTSDKKNKQMNVMYKRSSNSSYGFINNATVTVKSPPAFLGSRANQTGYFINGVKVGSTVAGVNPKESKSRSHGQTNQQKIAAIERGHASLTYPDTKSNDEKVQYSVPEPPQPTVTAKSPDTIATTKPVEESISAEEFNEIIESPFKPTHKNLLSTFSIDVDRASYSNMRRYLQQNQLPPSNAIRTEELLNYFTYKYPQPVNDEPFSITTEMGDCPWNPNHKLVHIGIQGKIVAMDKIPAMNLVFLVDVSGSMSSPNRLPLVIEALKMLTAQLRPQDKICIVTYAGSNTMALPSTPGSEKMKIYAALESLQSGGGTNGAAGINSAYAEATKNFIANGNNRVILCTDGDFNIGISNNEELEKLIVEKRKTGVFLSVLGFGMGNYKDNRMEMLADKGNGNYAYIDKIEEAKKVFVHEIGGTLYTIAKDVKIQMEFNPMFVKEYRLIGYENRLLNNEDFENDAIDAGDLGSGHTVTALYEIVPNLDKSEQGVLKYDPSDITPSKLEGNEWLYVKMRYKKPQDSVSRLLIHKLDNSMTKNATSNFYFSAAVAEFAMIMHKSLYKGTSNFEEVKRLVQENSADDILGYKKEFLSLIKTAEQLTTIVEARK